MWGVQGTGRSAEARALPVHAPSQTLDAGPPTYPLQVPRGPVGSEEMTPSAIAAYPGGDSDLSSGHPARGAWRGADLEQPSDAKAQPARPAPCPPACRVPLLCSGTGRPVGPSESLPCPPGPGARVQLTTVPGGAEPAALAFTLQRPGAQAPGRPRLRGSPQGGSRAWPGTGHAPAHTSRLPALQKQTLLRNGRETAESHSPR